MVVLRPVFLPVVVITIIMSLALPIQPRRRRKTCSPKANFAKRETFGRVFGVVSVSIKWIPLQNFSEDFTLQR
jgi:hypothetical protein